LQTPSCWIRRPFLAITAIAAALLVAPGAAGAADIARNSASGAGFCEEAATGDGGSGDLDFRRVFQRRYHSVPRQYHPKSPAIPPAISSPIATSKSFYTASRIPERNTAAPDPQTRKRLETRPDGQYQTREARYQDDSLMLRIGLVLGMLYVGFLAVWVWATRLRAH
jgi:hypothetical protein